MQNRAQIPNASCRINDVRRQTFKATLCRFFISLYLLSWVALASGSNATCPDELNPQLNPQRVVVKYGSSVSVNCSTNVTHKVIGWEATVGSTMTRTQSQITWRVPSMTRWDIASMCYMNYDKGQCESVLTVTVYKTPDSVSIITVDHTGPMTEGLQYELQCDVVNVAPVQNLIVKWYKGGKMVHNETFTDPIKTPVNKTSILHITVDRNDDGVQYRCEAEMDLGAEGPQPPPNVTSELLNITVHSQPVINETLLALNVSVFRGYPVVLVCEAEGNPTPTISWSDRNGHRLETADGNLTVPQFKDGDFYICTANNSVGTTTRRVDMEIQENDLLLIICIVVAIVVVILIISSFIIYTTYYKNTKMGQYILRNTTLNRKNKKGRTAQCL